MRGNFAYYQGYIGGIMVFDKDLTDIEISQISIKQGY
jgi:hypothetical protein